MRAWWEQFIDEKQHPAAGPIDDEDLEGQSGEEEEQKTPASSAATTAASK